MYILEDPLSDSFVMFIFSSSRYCYLLNDLTPEVLESKCSSYEDLQEYLRTRGREAYFQKAVSRFFWFHEQNFLHMLKDNRMLQNNFNQEK